MARKLEWKSRDRSPLPAFRTVGFPSPAPSACSVRFGVVGARRKPTRPGLRPGHQKLDMAMNDVRKMLEARIPGLHARIEKMLAEAESLYNDRTKQAPSEFLLEHARRTAAIAYKVALVEQVDP